jgi:hypothetical protein
MNLAESYYFDLKTFDLKFKSYQEDFDIIINQIKSYQYVKEIQVKEDIIKIYELKIKQFSLDFYNIIKTINYYNLSLIIYEAPEEAPETVYDSIGNISSYIFKDFKSLLDKINKENLQYLDFYELFLNLKEIKSELMSINIDRGYVSKESLNYANNKNKNYPSYIANITRKILKVPNNLKTTEEIDK